MKTYFYLLELIKYTYLNGDRQTGIIVLGNTKQLFRKPTTQKYLIAGLLRNY